MRVILVALIGAAVAAPAFPARVNLAKVDRITTVDCGNPYDPTCSQYSERGRVVSAEASDQNEPPESFVLRLPNGHEVTENVDPDQPLSSRQIKALRLWLIPGKTVSVAGTISGSGHLRAVRCISALIGACPLNAASHG